MIRVRHDQPADVSGALKEQRRGTPAVSRGRHAGRPAHGTKAGILHCSKLFPRVGPGLDSPDTPVQAGATPTNQNRGSRWRARS
jgi:hypothetical protein